MEDFFRLLIREELHLIRLFTTEQERIRASEKEMGQLTLGNGDLKTAPIVNKPKSSNGSIQKEIWMRPTEGLLNRVKEVL